MLFVPW